MCKSNGNTVISLVVVFSDHLVCFIQLLVYCSFYIKSRAFEEKRQKQEEREYQIREQILQQRKQKFEEVTEKFQRAHVPVSQRRRAGTFISGIILKAKMEV